MSRRDDGSEYDVPSWMIQIGRLFGLSEIQARWKAIRLLRSLKRAKEELAPPSSRVETRGCPSCHAAQPQTAKVCASCGAKMTTSFAAALRTMGLSLPPMITVSSLLMLANVGIYAFMWTRFPREAFGGWSSRHLLDSGANLGALSLHHEPWRLATYMFLHIGVIHIAFNMVALAQIGPTVEEVFGRGRMILFYVVTGVIAGLVSAEFQVALSAGASGALMGLVGVAAGWGHRLGTSVGRDVRNRMVQWGIYTMIFGVAVHADNLAHAGGFVSGALLGYAIKTEHIARPKVELVNVIAGIVGGVASVLAVMFILTRVASAQRTTSRDDGAALSDFTEDRRHLEALAAATAPPRAGTPPERVRQLEACIQFWQSNAGAEAAVLSAFGDEQADGGSNAEFVAAKCTELAQMRALCAELRKKSERRRKLAVGDACEDVP